MGEADPGRRARRHENPLAIRCSWRSPPPPRRLSAGQPARLSMLQAHRPAAVLIVLHISALPRYLNRMPDASKTGFRQESLAGVIEESPAAFPQESVVHLTGIRT